MRQISLTPSEARALFIGGALLSGDDRLLNVITGLNKTGVYIVVSGWNTYDAPESVRVKIERAAKKEPAPREEPAHFDWLGDAALQDYCVEHYMGTDRNASGKQQRVFLYIEDGKMWEGNLRAFYEHLSRLFGFATTTYGHGALNILLHGMGYPARHHETHGRRVGGKIYPPQEPVARACGDAREE